MQTTATLIFQCSQSCLTLLDRGSFISPEDLPNPGIKPRSPPLQVDSLPAEPQGQL